MPSFTCQYFTIDGPYFKELAEVYKFIPLMREFKKMKLWLDANPNRLKKNYKRFIINWLNKCKPDPEYGALSYREKQSKLNQRKEFKMPRNDHKKYASAVDFNKIFQPLVKNTRMPIPEKTK